MFGIIFLVFRLQGFAQKFEREGTWHGKLAVSGIELTLVFHIEQGDTGYIGTMDSPDQGGFGIKLGLITLNTDSVVITVPSA